MYRKTWMEIDLDGIEDNIRNIKNICGKKLIAVIKADGYGTGDRYLAEAAIRAGADMFAVSSAEEALILRNEGFDQEILILGPIDTEVCDIMHENNVTVAAFSYAWVKELVKTESCNGLKVHLKIDTGMNRIGFKDLTELKEAYALLINAGCNVEGIFTHFCCSDEPDHKRTDLQFSLFKEAVESLHATFKWIHCDNSDATIFFKDDLSNACRLGISIYGMSPYKHDLRKPVSLYTSVAMCKRINKGETVGYGAEYTASEDGEIIATCPIGYADGFIRANKGRNVYVNGKYATLVGRICMDQCMIRLDEEVAPGSIVEIFGEHIDLEDMAKDLHTITYEIISIITERVTRVYKKNGNVIAEVNRRMVRSSK